MPPRPIGCDAETKLKASWKIDDGGDGCALRRQFEGLGRPGKGQFIGSF